VHTLKTKGAGPVGCAPPFVETHVSLAHAVLQLNARNRRANLMIIFRRAVSRLVSTQLRRDETDFEKWQHRFAPTRRFHMRITYVLHAMYVVCVVASSRLYVASKLQVETRSDETDFWPRDETRRSRKNPSQRSQAALRNY